MHRLSAHAEQGITISLFERLEIQQGNELNTPIVGVPELAEGWIASINLSLNWGAPPLQAPPPPISMPSSN